MSRWSEEEHFFKPLIKKAVSVLVDGAGDYISLPIARRDDPIIWVDGRPVRQFTRLVVWREDWSDRETARQAIETELRRQVKRLDEERR